MDTDTARLIRPRFRDYGGGLLLIVLVVLGAIGLTIQFPGTWLFFLTILLGFGLPLGVFIVAANVAHRIEVRRMMRVHPEAGEAMFGADPHGRPGAVEVEFDRDVDVVASEVLDALLDIGPVVRDSRRHFQVHHDAVPQLAVDCAILAEGGLTVCTVELAPSAPYLGARCLDLPLDVVEELRVRGGRVRGRDTP